VDEKGILDSSGQPVKTVHLAGDVVAAVKRPGLNGWTLAVLALQTLILIFQTYLFTRQTTLMDGQAGLVLCTALPLKMTATGWVEPKTRYAASTRRATL
jgi:hypothetical protein